MWIVACIWRVGRGVDVGALERELSMLVMWFSPDLEMKVSERFTNTAIKL